MDILALLIGGSPAALGSSFFLSRLGVYAQLFEGHMGAPAQTRRELPAGPKEER